jgi:integrase
VSLYRRPNSPHWWVRFQINGREVRLSAGTADRRQAEEFETAARGRAWRQAKLGERPPYPWTAARTRWLAETQKRTKWKDETILSWFDEHLKDADVQGITREVVDELRALKAEVTSPATADRYMALLRAILRKCVHDWQVLDAMPKVPMYRPRAAEPRFLTRVEFERLAAKLPPHLALAARFAVLTGLRMRSMLALEWPRIDLNVRRAWIPGEQMKAGRTHGVPLSRAAVAVLRKLRKLSPDGDRVFQWNKHPIDDCNTKAFQDAVKAAKLAPLRWHDLRHTWASWGVQSGVTLPELMQLGGWASYVMVLRYAHLAPDHLAAAAEKVSKLRTKTGTRRNRSVGSEQALEFNGKGGTRTLDPGIMSAVL